MTSGDKIRAERMRRNVKQAWLARTAGISEHTLYHIEKGTHEPRVTTLVLIATALNVPAASLLPDEESIKG